MSSRVLEHYCMLPTGKRLQACNLGKVQEWKTHWRYEITAKAAM